MTVNCINPVYDFFQDFNHFSTAAAIDVKFKSRDQFLIHILILKAEGVSVFTVKQTD